MSSRKIRVARDQIAFPLREEFLVLRLLYGFTGGLRAFFRSNTEAKLFL